jgi:hypothetical protein
MVGQRPDLIESELDADDFKGVQEGPIGHVRRCATCNLT